MAEEKTGKQKRENQGTPNPSFALDKAGSLERVNKTCPKCGPGVFLAGHKDRFHCGRCGYTEFAARKGARE